MLGTASYAHCSFGVCLVWGCLADKRGDVAHPLFVLFGAGEEGQGIEDFMAAFLWLFLSSHPISLLFYKDEFRSWAKLKPHLGNFFLWPPQSAIGRPLLLLINDLPAVYTDLIAFMYAHASYFKLLLVKPTQRTFNMSWSLWSVFGMWSTSLGWFHLV